MHPVTLIAKALSAEEAPYPESCGTDICCVTGDYGPVVKRRALFGPSFTDGALLVSPESLYVGVDTYRAMKYKWERMSSWFCNGEDFTRLDRVGVRDAVFTRHKDHAWCGYATTSYKKHGAVRAPVNTGDNAVWLFEVRIVDCSDRGILFEWWEKLNAALRSGIGRQVLESLDCPGFIMRKVGLECWMAFEQWARPRYKSALYAFLCYLLPSQKELKEEAANGV